MKSFTLLALLFAVGSVSTAHAFTLGCDERTPEEYKKIATDLRAQAGLIEKDVLTKIRAGTDRQDPVIIQARETQADLEASALASASCSN